jgi:hypothetical protein
LLVVEDAHWIDPTMLEMIEHALDRIANTRALILLTSRPDGQPPLTAHSHVARLTLNRLGSTGVEAIVARLGGENLLRDMVDTIIARTDGVPLFVEELTKAVLETGDTTIPASLHGSIEIPKSGKSPRSPRASGASSPMACAPRAISRGFGPSRASTPPTSRTPRRCSTSWHERAMLQHLTLISGARSAGRLQPTR